MAGLVRATHHLMPDERWQKRFASTPMLMMRKRAEFLAVQRGGVKRVSDAVVFQARRRPASGVSADTLRIGFTASRKIGNAVKRNRAKRRMRAWAQHYLHSHISGQIDIVMIARARILTMGWPAFVVSCNKAAQVLETQLQADRQNARPSDRRPS